jgi:hypothetical protein
LHLVWGVDRVIALWTKVVTPIKLIDMDPAIWGTIPLGALPNVVMERSLLYKDPSYCHQLKTLAAVLLKVEQLQKH